MRLWQLKSAAIYGWALCLWAGAATAKGESWDVTLATGIGSGKLSQPEDETHPKRTVSYGGNLMAFSINRDLFQWASFSFTPSVMIDSQMGQVVMQSLHLALQLHLAGGGIDVRRTTKVADFTESADWAVSFLVKTGLNYYGLSSPTNTDDSIKGSVLVVMSGLSAQKAMMKNLYLGAEVAQDVMQFPASTDRLHATLVEVLGFIRFLY